jgi:hypothetical protein
MRTEYKPNEAVIDKAISIWKKILLKPKYDNGDDASPIAGMLASLTPNNANDQNLESFGKELKILLMNSDKEHEGKYNTIYYHTSIDVDYHPCKILQIASEKAELKLEFPWKTSMYLYNDKLSFSYGYSAGHIHYYLLKNGKWLVTSLTGDDIEKIKEYVTEGKELNFQVED